MLRIAALGLLLAKPIVNTWGKKGRGLGLVVYQVSLKRLLSKALFCALRNVSVFSL